MTQTRQEFLTLYPGKEQEIDDLDKIMKYVIDTLSNINELEGEIEIEVEAIDYGWFAIRVKLSKYHITNILATEIAIKERMNTTAYKVLVSTWSYNAEILRDRPGGVKVVKLCG